MHKIVLALFLLGIVGISWGQAPEVLTVNDVVRLALERNELSAITNNQLEQAELKIKQARSYLFPKLTANAVIQKTYILPEKRLPGGLEIRSGNITLNQPLYTFGRLSAGVDIANIGKDITTNSVKASRADIVKAAKQIFYNAVYNKQVLKIAQESLANANKNKSALGDRVSFGRINQNDNIKMQADVASRKPLVYEATKGYEAALQDLASFLDIPVNEIKEVTADLSDSSRVPMVERPVERFVDVATAVNNQKMAAAQEDLAKNDYMPTLSAFASYSPSHTPASASLPGVLLTDTAAIGLRLDLDLPLGGTKVYERKIRTVDLNNAELNLRRIRREVSKQQTSLIQQYKTLESKNETLKNAVNLAEKAYRVSLASFKNGSIGQLQLNDTELLLTSNKISYVQNLLQQKLIQTELERLQTEGRK